MIKISLLSYCNAGPVKISIGFFKVKFNKLFLKSYMEMQTGHSSDILEEEHGRRTRSTEQYLIIKLLKTACC